MIRTEVRKMIAEISEEQRNEFQERVEEELEKAHPSYSDSDPDGEVSERDEELMEQFAEEFNDELQGDDSRKMMFIMDVAIHTGETPDQLRELINEMGIEPLYQARMGIHLTSKDLVVSYAEAAQIATDFIYGTEKGTRLQ
jgi:hypothetical protein